MTDPAIIQLAEKLESDAKALLLGKMGLTAKAEILEAIPANLREAAKRLREVSERESRYWTALVAIKDGRGQCGHCGEPAIGSVGGVVGYGCCEDPRAFWVPSDPKEIARSALLPEPSAPPSNQTEDV